METVFVAGQMPVWINCFSLTMAAKLANATRAQMWSLAEAK
jgi:hypothetical protein